MMKIFIIGGIIMVIVVAGFLILKKEPLQQNENIMATLTLKSSAFKDGEIIPTRFTCEGENVNPLLEIRNAPEGTKSFVLLMDDPDAPSKTWVHWVVWNIEPKTQYISEDSLPGSALQGTNSSNTQKYIGPCPPKGDKPHHYHFKLYALDTDLNLAEGAKKEEVEKAMAGHILGQTLLTGLYQRK